MIVVAAIERDWIGLLFVIVLLSSVLTVFLPKVRQADTASRQSPATWQAAFVIFVGTIIIVAGRWSIWSNQLPPPDVSKQRSLPPSMLLSVYDSRVIMQKNCYSRENLLGRVCVYL